MDLLVWISESQLHTHQSSHPSHPRHPWAWQASLSFNCRSSASSTWNWIVDRMLDKLCSSSVTSRGNLSSPIVAASTFSKSACMKADSTTSPIGIVFFPFWLSIVSLLAMQMRNAVRWLRPEGTLSYFCTIDPVPLTLKSLLLLLVEFNNKFFWRNKSLFFLSCHCKSRPNRFWKNCYLIGDVCIITTSRQSLFHKKKNFHVLHMFLENSFYSLYSSSELSAVSLLELFIKHGNPDVFCSAGKGISCQFLAHV